MSAFLRALADVLDSGQSCATATLIDSVGSTPGKTGHHMIVLPDGSIRFTIGGGPLEATIIEDCRSQLRQGANAVKEYRLLPAGDDAVGMVCGGSVRVFIEVHPATARLVVFGAGHVGSEVIRMASGLGWRRVLADDRREMLDAATIDPDVERVHCPARFAGNLPAMDERTHVVVVTRCHETDREIVAQLVDEPVAYLGMIGSRRKVETVLGELDRRGIARTRLAHLHAPIGLDIGARSPTEIAVAILAEIVCIRNREPATTEKTEASVGATN